MPPSSLSKEPRELPVTDMLKRKMTLPDIAAITSPSRPNLDSSTRPTRLDSLKRPLHIP
ncbi:hypothetical protein BDZ89DRAFT_1077087, partial [Hymenopellis radicata]